jgi:hypothetical protein
MIVRAMRTVRKVMGKSYVLGMLFRLTNDRGIVQLQRANILHCISGLPGLQASAVKRRPISNGINLVAPRRRTVVVLPHGVLFSQED